MKRVYMLVLSFLLIVNTVFIPGFATDEHTVLPVDEFSVDFELTREFSQTSFIYNPTNITSNDIWIDYTVYPRPVPVSVIPNDIPPKEIVLIVDVSGSMGRRVDNSWVGSDHPDSRMSIVKEAMRDFVEEVSKSRNVKVGIVKYSSSAYQVAPLTDVSNGQNLDYFNKKSYPKGVITNLYASGGTNIGDGIRKGYYMLKHGNPNAEKYLVMMTDGEATKCIWNYNTDKYHFDEYGGSVYSSSNKGKEYARLFAAKLTDENISNFEEGYFVAFSHDSAADKLKEIAGSINTFKQAITANDMATIYQSISRELSSDVSASGLLFTDEIPDGLDVISMPNGMTYEDGVLVKTLGNVIYSLNGDQYEAEPISFRVKVRPSAPGTFEFNGQLSFNDVDGSNKVSVFPGEANATVDVLTEPVENVQVIRHQKAVTIKDDEGKETIEYVNTNSVQISWSKFDGSFGYNVYKERPNGELVRINRIESSDATSMIYDIQGEDDGSTKFFVESILKKTEVTYDVTDLKKSPATDDDGEVIDGVRLKWDRDSNCKGYEIYKVNENNELISIITLTDNHITEYYYRSYNGYDVDQTYIVKAVTNEDEVSSKGSAVGDTNLFIQNVEAERKNNQVVISWDMIPNVSYSIQPIYNDGSTDNNLGVINNTQIDTVVNKRVYYTYDIQDPNSYVSYVENMRFEVRGHKADTVITPDQSNRLALKLSVLTEVYNHEPLAYAEQNKTLVRVNVDDKLPEGSALYDPILKVQFIYPNYDDLPLNISYPMIRARKNLGTMKADGSHHGTNMTIDVYEDDWANHVIYISLADYVGESLISGDDFEFDIEYAVALGSDEFGTMKKETMDTIRGDVNTSINTAFEIPFSFTSLLESFYKETSNNKEPHQVDSINELLKIKVSVLYNASPYSSTADPRTRDTSIGVSENYVQFKNKDVQSSEF